MMKLYAPEYYRDFSCIAGKCRHSCCIGWEIDIDPSTLLKYHTLTAPYGNKVRDSIDSSVDPASFRLTKDKRCPHLDDGGLCKIIINLGEEYLCNICSEHPRFYNDTSHGKEVGLGMACEEAARLILSSDGYRNISPIGEAEGEPVAGYDPLPLRQKLYTVLSDRSVPYSERLSSIRCEFGTSPDIIRDGRWREILGDLEYLDSRHRELFISVYSSSTDTPKEHAEHLERALAYFIYRHCSCAESESEFNLCLGFSLFCERLIASLIKNDDRRTIAEYARIVSEELEYSPENTETVKLEFLF